MLITLFSLIPFKANSLVLGASTSGIASAAFYVTGGLSTLFSLHQLGEGMRNSSYWKHFHYRVGAITLATGIILCEDNESFLAEGDEIVKWATDNYYSPAVISEVTKINKHVSNKKYIGKNIEIKKFKGNMKSRVKIIKTSLEKTYGLKNVSLEAAQVYYEFAIQ